MPILYKARIEMRCSREQQAQALLCGVRARNLRRDFKLTADLVLDTFKS